MKIVNCSDKQLLVTSYVVFDPWPFADQYINLTDETKLLLTDGTLDTSKNFYLNQQCENTLATLSNGMLVVCVEEIAFKHLREQIKP